MPNDLASLPYVATRLFAAHATLQSQINALTQKVNTMSGTLSAQLTALEATLTTQFAALEAEVTAAVAAFASVNAGDVITQAQLDSLTTLSTNITAATASLTAAVNPPAPAPAP